MTLTVAKVGGSLFDLPDLADRLRCWRATVAGPVLLVPGGGDGADVIRRLDRTHQLGDETAHWLALRVLSVNAHLLAALLSVPVVSSPVDLVTLTRPERKRRTNLPPSLTLRSGEETRAALSPLVFAVLDPHAFCISDEGSPGALPHYWDVTSDAIAARVAEAHAADLALLKSVDLPNANDWEAAARMDLVDPAFGEIVRRAGLKVNWVNLRRHAR